MTEILLIDDERRFSDNRPSTIARTSEEGIEALTDKAWDEVWLDFILQFDDTMTVVRWIREQYHAGNPVQVGIFYVHSSALGAYSLIDMVLSPLGYTVENTFGPGNTLTKD